ncbi:3438_t:CDS:2, partial [Funneliformis mosseae]
IEALSNVVSTLVEENLLEDIDEKQYKLFHDEVVQVLNGLDESLQLDPSKNGKKSPIKVEVGFTTVTLTSP